MIACACGGLIESFLIYCCAGGGTIGVSVWAWFKDRSKLKQKKQNA